MIFRKEYGHANIATLVERKSRYTVLFRNNDRQSKPIMARLIRISDLVQLQNLPENLPLKKPIIAIYNRVS